MQSHDNQTVATMEVVRRYNEAFDAHDVDGIMAAMTEDCVFDSPGPAPDGTCFQGSF